MSESHGQPAAPSPRRVGVIGAGGQLGRCLVRQANAAPDLELVFALSRSDLDLAQASTLEAEIEAILDRPEALQPEVVVNAAAYTKVDLCESETELAYQTNALAPGAWAAQLARRGIRFVHVSTDYVFPGDGDRPYRESDPTAPRTVYGASKRAGEVAVLGHDPTALVVRTSWVFGPGRNFVVAILDQAMKRRRGEATGPLRVVDDQQGSPTSAEDLAFALLAIARQESHEWGGGLLHLCNSGVTTWFGFAREILDQAGFEDIAIDPVPSSAFETAARRPAYSVLDCRWAEGKGIAMPPFKEALNRYLLGPDRPEPLGAPPEQAPATTSATPSAVTSPTSSAPRSQDSTQDNNVPAGSTGHEVSR